MKAGFALSIVCIAPSLSTLNHDLIQTLKNRVFLICILQKSEYSNENLF